MVNCPQCACAVPVDTLKLEKDPNVDCPVCGNRFDAKREIAKQKLVNDIGISVIQFEGDNNIFVWKHPIEDFNLGTQLIVHESQEAVFFLGGEIMDTFSAGKYTLETESIPILKKIYDIPSGSQTPFHSEVYFINKAVQMPLKWGTDTRVRFIDPLTGIPLDIGASGEMNLQVADSKKLLLKLVGTTDGLVASRKEDLSTGSEGSAKAARSLKSFFRAPLMTEIKSSLATSIKEQHINILEIDQHLSLLSEAPLKRVAPKFEEFGISVTQFYVSNIALPEEDENFAKIKELIVKKNLDTRLKEAERDLKRLDKQMEAESKIIEAQGSAESEKVREFAKIEIERAGGLTEAEVARAKGLSEADVMRAKGYTGKDVMAAEVGKTFAAGLGAMSSGSSSGSSSESSSGSGNGSGTGRGLAADVVGAVAQLKIADKMLEKLDGIWDKAASDTEATLAGGMNPDKPEDDAVKFWKCSCGEDKNLKNFCMSCGKPKPVEVLWNCPNCGEKGITSKFCPECGFKRPEDAVPWDCPNCGAKNITSKFCPECGSKRS